MILQAINFSTGLTGMGYQFYDVSGNLLADRTTTGIAELGSTGVYVAQSDPAIGAVGVYWNDTDTGEEAWEDLAVAIAVNSILNDTDEALPAAIARLKGDMIVTGTLAYDGTPVTFDALKYTGISNGKPYYTNGGTQSLIFDGDEWELSDSGGAVWMGTLPEGSPDTPDDVVTWTPDGDTTGDPTITTLRVALNSDVDAILVDTGTTIPGLISTAQADLDTITGSSGVNLLTATQASIDAIEVDTGTTIPGLIPTVGNIRTELATELARIDVAVSTRAESVSSGSGAFAITVNVKDALGANLQGATVRMTEGVNSYVATTDATGDAAFSLDTATYTYNITKDGYQDDDPSGTVAISAEATVSLTMTATVSPAAPSDPTLISVFLNSGDIIGTVVTDLRIGVTLSVRPSVSGDGRILSGSQRVMVHQTGTPGQYVLPLERSTIYVASCKLLWSTDLTFTTPALGASYDLKDA